MGDWVLDQFLGSGTTLIEAKLLNRNAVGVDINPQSIILSKANLDFSCDSKAKIYIKNGNAAKLSFMKDNGIDFICTHPPYADVINYSNGIVGDISLLKKTSYLNEMEKVAKESIRVLKSNKYCAVMIGDIRKNGSIIPLGFEVMQCFLSVGFKLKEIIIKEQYNCRSTKKWEGINKNFLMLAHEYIFVFRK